MRFREKGMVREGERESERDYHKAIFFCEFYYANYVSQVPVA